MMRRLFVLLAALWLVILSPLVMPGHSGATLAQTTTTTTTTATTAGGTAAANTNGNGNGTVQPDFDLWDRQAAQAEAILQADSANEARLNSIRAQVVTWREAFQTAQNPNATRIAVLKAQIAALGPAPAEGTTEAEDVAQRRKELNDQLAAEQAPALRATEAYGRADGIIQEIDRQLRARQTSALLHLSPSPLLPSSVSAAAGEASRLLTALAQELHQRRENLSDGYLRDRLPTVLALLVGAVLLLTIGRRRVDTLPALLSARASVHARAAVAFVVSLLQIMLPFFGLMLLMGAAFSSDMLGSYGQPLLLAFAGAALTYFMGRWIVTSFFARLPDSPPPLALPAAKAAKARRLGTWLALILSIYHMVAPAILPLAGMQNMGVEVDTIPQRFTEAAAGVWYMPLLLGAGLVLFRLGHLLRRMIREAPDEPPPYRYRVAAVLGAASRVIAVAAPVAALAGFVSAANSLIWPWISTLGLLGLLTLLQKFIGDLWLVIKRGQEGAQNALAPVLIGFALALLALPFLALIWGARTSDLGEVWNQIRHGIAVGGITISPMAMLTFLVVFAAGYTITRGVQGAVRGSILPKTRLDAGAQNAVVAGLGYLGIFLAALMAITSAGIDMSSFAIVAGALSVGIGFGLQNIVSNFVSGIILLIERPVTVGDWIQVGQAQGYVQRISVRSTQIRTFDRSEVIVPNSDLITGTVTNWTRGNLQGRIIVPVSVGYGSDSRRVEQILMQIAEDQPLVLVSPGPTVLFTQFGADGLNFELRAVLSDVNQGSSVTSEIRHQILERFRKEGIEIPFTTRDIWLRNPYALARALHSDTANGTDGAGQTAGTGQTGAGQTGATG